MLPSSSSDVSTYDVSRVRLLDRRLAEVRRYLDQMYRLDSHELDLVAPVPEPPTDVLMRAAETGHIPGFTTAHPLYEADASNPARFVGRAFTLLVSRFTALAFPVHMRSMFKR